MELLIATVLITIVMAGVVAFSYGVKSMQDSTSRASVLAMRSTALMSRMSRDISLAVGYIDNQGIVVSGPGDEIAVRQDVGGTPANYTDDEWFIYRFDSGTYELEVCEHSNDSTCSTSWTMLSNQVEDCEFSLTANSDPAAPQFSVHVILNTAYTPGGVADPLENPTVSLSTDISPAGHSWN